MARIVVLDPTAPPPEDQAGPGPAVDALAGKRVGIRLDRAWRSFEWVSEEWAQAFREAGAEVVRWVAGNRVGEEGERTQSELERFADDVDLAVIGLGN